MAAAEGAERAAAASAPAEPSEQAVAASERAEAPAPAAYSAPADRTERGVALVTGAGRGIGRAVATRLSSEGYAVALTARHRDQLAETAAECAGRAVVLPADITAAGAVEQLFAAVEEQLGPVGVLVANAGAGTSARVEKTSDETWQWMLDVNLTAPFRCIRRAIPAMRTAGWGRIVVVASVAARVGAPYLSAYAASKHGVLGLVRTAAAELAPTGVTVNAVCPGYVDTPMTEASVHGIVELTGRSAGEAREILARKQPTGRLVTADEVAEAVWFCVVNGSVNGQGINVDGGAVPS
ncbi:MAG TPA: SDR family oxidoreductase [Nocardioidaceae bacterium]|nr:SDR family oxidoreductase [Nocardioidaceae bacterium]